MKKFITLLFFLALINPVRALDLTFDDVINQHAHQKSMYEKAMVYDKSFSAIVKAKYQPSYFIEEYPKTLLDTEVLVKLKVKPDGTITEKTVVKNKTPELIRGIDKFLSEIKMPKSDFTGDFYALASFNPRVKDITSDSSGVVYITQNEEELDNLIKIRAWSFDCREKIRKEFLKYTALGYSNLQMSPTYILISNDGGIMDYGFVKKNARPDEETTARLVLNAVRFEAPPVFSPIGYYPIGVLYSKTPKAADVALFNPLTYKEFNWVEYMKEFEKKIKPNWKPPRSYNSSLIEVYIEINKDGSIHSLSIKTSSGNKEADEAALEAVRKSAPFEPLPSMFAKSTIPVEFSFGYRVMGKSKEYDEKTGSKEYNEARERVLKGDRSYPYSKLQNGSFKEYMEAVREYKSQNKKH